MKKNRLFFLFIAFSSISFSAFSQQIVEGFESNLFPPSAWELITTKGTGFKISTEYPRTGSRAAFVDFEEISNGDMGEGDSWLIMPKLISIQAGDNLSFYFRPQYSDKLNLANGEYDSLLVYISTTDKNPESFTKIYGINNSELSTSYTKIEIPLGAYAGSNIYIAIRNHQSEGNGFFIDDVTAGTALNNDAGSLSLNLNNNPIIAVGTSIKIVDTVKNFGANSLPSGIPVKYTINDGPAVALATSVPLAPGATTVVEFDGTNAFTPFSPGIYTLKVFTDFASESNPSNDTVIYKINVQQPLSTFPYFTEFNNNVNWSQGAKMQWQKRVAFNVAGLNREVINPAGFKDSAMVAFTFYDTGTFVLRTPLLDFSSVSKPMINFYVAAKRAGPSSNDILSVVVSTDGGVTYNAVPLYEKSNTTSSKLETVPASQVEVYIPSSASDWRHEIVDLSAYAGLPNVMVAFKVKSGNSNNVWIDNVNIIDQPTATYHAENVTSGSQVVTGALGTKVTFHSIPVSDFIRMQGHNTAPVTMENWYATNTTATTPGGNIEQPNFVFDRYVTIAYSGNSVVRATYDISMDYSGLPGVDDPDKLYILKRADQSGKWVALSTTRSGTILTATGLNNFSDFAIGYYSIAVPVNIISFSGYLTNNNTSALNWKTAQEKNINNFEVQRLNNGSWSTLGIVNSNQSSLSNNYSFTDFHPQSGENYYRLKINGFDQNSNFSQIVKVTMNTSGNKVYQNIPNPVKDYTLIRYDLANKANVKIIVYDVNGSEISQLANGPKEAGSYQIRFNTSNLAAGTYFYKVIIDGEAQSRTMVKLK